MLENKLSSNKSSQDKVGFQVLSESQVKDIHEASLEILQTTGVNIHLKETRDMLEDAGCKVEGEKVYFPPGLVEWAIDAAPSRTYLYDRNGENPLTLGGHNTTFGLGPTLLNMRDPETGERRPFRKQDTVNAARLVDALDNIDWVSGLGTIDDVPHEHSDRHEFEAMVKNTTKPIVAWSYTNEGLEDIIDMASAVAGSKEEFLRKPFVVSYSEPISPLTHDKDASEKLLMTADYGIPTIHTPIPQAGASAPVTLAGQLAQGNAESLSGLVISQVRREGLPYFIGGVLSIMDMQTAILAYGAPEKELASAAYMDIAHHYDIPTFGTAGCTDSKVVDQQAGIEAMFSSLFSTLSGANLVHDVGYTESGSTGSLSQIAMVDEIVGMLKKFTNGIEVNDYTLALDVIDEIGPEGDHLTHKHTLDNFEEVAWHPTLMDRNVPDTWKDEGEKTMEDRLQEKVNEILEEHEPEPLPDDVVEEIDRVIESL
ncbi:trimethylamine methyltransferase family protein [Candidatus Bipolaricaulota bacterium]|nr:trimethylamine methyltransferase family protein [Candidatus Bipolaricaulota bacterium]